MESHEQTELTNKIETDSESRLATVGVGCWVGGMEGLNKKEKRKKELMDMDNSVVIAWGGI